MPRTVLYSAAMSLIVVATVPPTVGQSPPKRASDPNSVVEDRCVFEDLGRPFRMKSLSMEVVTNGARPIAWAGVESPTLHDVIGIDLESGELIELGIGPRYGRFHQRLHRADNGHLYIYAGRPGRFFKYDVHAQALIDLGVPASPAYYHLGHAIGPDGSFYVGTYPNGLLVCVDPRTDTIRRVAQMRDDPKQKYILRTEVSDENVVYCAVGLRYAELWSYDNATDQKRQILPEELARGRRSVSLMLAEDGNVYGYTSGKMWRCLPNGIEYVSSLPEPRERGASNVFGDHEIRRIDGDGRLERRELTTGQSVMMETDFDGVTSMIYSVGDFHEGKLYGGGGWHTANLFRFDVATGMIEDLGQQGGGNVQVYDVLGLPGDGVVQSSYPGGFLDHFDTETGKRKSIEKLARKLGQERCLQLTLGPDGMVYTVTVPIKGRLGGAIVRIDPADWSVRGWTDVLPRQSFQSIVPVPSQGEMFVTSSVQGGTSAIPTENEAFVLFWDCEREEVVWKGRPIPGTRSYGRAAIGANGLIYGIAGNRYYVLDPRTREVIRRDRLPVSRVRHLAFDDHAAGPEGWIHGLGDDAVFAIDPDDHEARVLARHPSIESARGIAVADDGSVYYGSGPQLWRMRPLTGAADRR
jgi:outer membrane protein assembly factor BamB